MSRSSVHEPVTPASPPSGENPAWKWLAVVYALILGGVLFSCLWGSTLGFDVWFHLENGWRILSERAIPHDDPSLPALARLGPWYFPNYEWLFGVLSYAVFRAAGTSGLDALRLALVVFTWILCLANGLRAMRAADPAREGVSWKSLSAALGVLALAAAASAQRFEPRPHLVSALGLAWLSFIFSTSPSRPTLVMTAMLLAAWANSHIEFMLGLVLIVLLAVRDLLAAHFAAAREPPGSTSPAAEVPTGNSASPTPAWFSRVRVHAVLLAVGVTAFLLTPASWRVIPLAGEYYARQAATVQQFGFGVNELLPLEGWWSGPWGMLSGLGLLALASTHNRRSALLLGLPGFAFLLLPFTSARHLYPAAVVLAPILIGWLAGGMQRLEAGGRTGKACAAIVAVGLFPVVLWLHGAAFANPRLPHPILEPGPAAYLPSRPYNFFPEQALRFLAVQKLKGTVFTLDRWGNFLLAFEGLTSATPERRPFIHNMGQTFPYRLLEEYLQLITDPQARQKLIDFHGIEIFLLPLRHATYFRDLADWLQQSPDWKLVTWDDTAAVYLRTASSLNPRPDLPGYRAIRPAAFMAEEALLRKIPDLDLAISELERHIATDHGRIAWISHLWLGTLLEWLGNEPRAIEVLRQARTLNPSGFAALFRLGGLLGKAGRTAEAKEALDQARAVCPSDAANRFNLAVAFRKTGQLADCLELLRSSLEADPGFAPARNLLGTLSR